MSSEALSRRRLLKGAGIAVASALAGCSTASSSSSSSSRADSQATATGTATPTGAVDDAGETATETASGRYAQVYEQAIDSVTLVDADGGQGTGFMYDESHVVTNAHVVNSVESVNVRFHDGQWSDGSVAGVDRHSDLAVIAVEEAPAAATGLPFVQSEPTVGQEVVAIGNPYSLDGSLTTGVISGLDRTIQAPTGYQIPDAVQTDAAANPGNSGGPLMSLDGRVVAVINSGGGDNIAFGISTALTQQVVPSLIETGDYEHSYMGVSMSNVTPTVAEENDLDESRGLLVVTVVDGGPADGVLQPSSDVQFVDGQRVPVGGDVILSVDGTQLSTTEDLMSYLALHTRPGDAIEITVVREGEQQTVELELGSRPDR